MFTIYYQKLYGQGSCEGNVTAATNKTQNNTPVTVVLAENEKNPLSHART